MGDFWKCGPCHGTGRKIIAGQAIKCRECDGTGNALVDGPAREHQRELDAIDAAARKAALRSKECPGNG